jgi:DNA-binding response OmpR family regulator
MQRRVLVVEDDSATRTLLAAGLSEDFEVADAANGREAIGQLESGRFDSVVLDLMMPVLDGFGVLHFLESHRPELLRRVVVVTGAGDPMKSLLPVDRLGAVLTKPCGIRELSTIVRRCASRGS